MRTEEIKRVAAVVLFAFTLAATALYAASQEKGRPAGQNPETIAIEPRFPPPRPPVPPPPLPSVTFRADIWPDRQVYNIGDLVRINFRVTRPCYVYIFDTDTRGVTRQIFPNYFDPDNFVVPGGFYSLPDASYNLRVVGPPGPEELRIVAVRYRAAVFERQHRFTPQDPFPAYAEGSRGFLNQYQREEKRPDSDALKRSETQTPPRGERKEELRSRETAPGTKPPKPAAESKERVEVGGKRRAESIAIEPVVPPQPRAIIPEPRPIVYDRDWVEAAATFQVVDPYAQPVPQYGRLDVNSTPQGARVIVDSVVRGYTPLSVRGLDPGVHLVEISLGGYATFSKEIEVREGQASVVNVRLRAERPRWFFDFDFRL